VEGGASRRWAEAGVAVAFVSLALAAVCSRADASRIPTVQTPPNLPQVIVPSDNIRVTSSCRLILAPRPIPDEDGNGVLQVEGDNIQLDLGGQVLRGFAPETPPDALRGIGIRVRGKNIRIFNGSVQGFAVGIDAADCSGLVLEQLDFVHLRSQRLQSTLEREDQKDWLWPHENDQGEWAERYGAAVSVRDATGITLRQLRVRRSQNGILLSRVLQSTVCDIDASFLSGWGIALWRSSGNTICRNSVDFCVRGYSHGTYARGQDSAGILLFEQCNDNTIALNSATHCGDGIFLFAGREALGERTADPPHDGAWFERRGCNGNRIIGNDCSDAAAHGIEATFSFGNQLIGNRIDRAAICGIWGGYSQQTVIAGNLIRDGSDDGPAGERAAISMEHASGTTICGNQIERSGFGIRLWVDDDPQFAKLPWVAANSGESAPTRIFSNAFTDVDTAVELRRTPAVQCANNEERGVRVSIGGDERSVLAVERMPSSPPCPGPLAMQSAFAELPGSASAVEIDDRLPRTSRRSVEGRASILMGTWGPHDFVTPMLIREPSPPHEHRWRLLGNVTARTAQLTDTQGDLRADLDDNYRAVLVHNPVGGQISSYRMAVSWGTLAHQIERGEGTLIGVNWRVSVFALPSDADAASEIPTPDSLLAAAASGQVVYLDCVSFRLGAGTLQEARVIDGEAGSLRDRFGLLATGTTIVPQGEWLLRVRSDDGVRVQVDGKTLIERWNRHGTMEDTATLSVATPRELSLQVLYFELSGAAELDVRLERIGMPPPKSRAETAP
jgi:parallel beta-helix repeat protein